MNFSEGSLLKSRELSYVLISPGEYHFCPSENLDTTSMYSLNHFPSYNLDDDLEESNSILANFDNNNTENERSAVESIEIISSTE